jgi:feruloyl esterase
VKPIHYRRAEKKGNAAPSVPARSRGGDPSRLRTGQKRLAIRRDPGFYEIIPCVMKLAFSDCVCRRLAFIGVSLVCIKSLAAASCESLISLTLPDTAVTLAVPVAAGALLQWPGPGVNAPAALMDVAPNNLPAFCRVELHISPSQDSDIKAEVWLPASGWNGRFMAVGNGGWSGAISYKSMAAAVARGYATASTNTGHDGGPEDGRFAQGHPEKVVDFAYRSVHETTVRAKAIIAAYYGSSPRFSYWNGCSTGGKQGLKEAQRFPVDFDGIVAGAPASDWIHLQAQFVWVAQAAHKDQASYIPPEKYALIHRAVLKACDAADGVTDGVLEDPTRCKFDPIVLRCNGADSSDCLTESQVELARTIYSAALNPRTHQPIFPGLARGSELGWAAQAGPVPSELSIDHFKYLVFKNPAWDYKAFNFDSDLELADRLDNGLITATDPNLRPFFARGGKLLQYHGWADPLISPFESIHYYEEVSQVLGAHNIENSYRLFMIPGMDHCRVGNGVNSFDSISVIEQWVENHQAPDRIPGSRIVDAKQVRTRPLCPYPQVVRYKGTGTTDDALNFVCSVAK